MVDSWYKTKKLSVNPEKTEVVFFTRKRKTDRVVRLNQGVKLNQTKEVKCLGIILDDKLTWTAYVETQLKEVLKAVWSCQTLIKRTHGLTSKMAL